MNYIFDGSYQGFLCCVFECFEMKEWHAVPVAEGLFQPDIFLPERTIFTDVDKAQRIQKALKSKFGKSLTDDIYRAFLSEDPVAWQAAYYVMVRLFKGQYRCIGKFWRYASTLLPSNLKKSEQGTPPHEGIYPFQQK